jgi:hypothetical protein
VIEVVVDWMKERDLFVWSPDIQLL